MMGIYFEYDGMRWNVRALDGTRYILRDERIANIGIVDGSLDLVPYVQFVAVNPIADKYVRDEFTKFLREEGRLLKVSKEWIDANVDYFIIIKDFYEQKETYFQPNRDGIYNLPDGEYEILLDEKMKEAVENRQIKGRFEILLKGNWTDAVPYGVR